ncbi:MAG: YqgE/AlgH family protein [Rickettsiales bacterium]|nr:YqgE/AlgH family protein [Rickettsiales bacterium]
MIYLFAHNDEGAMGIIINQPLELVHYSALLDEQDMPESHVAEEVSVYYGGPVDRSRGFVIHSDEYLSTEPLIQENGIAVSANTGVLKDMVQGRGPRHATLAVGYAGWSAGQLEQEIEENSWITVPADPRIIFELDDEMKWGMASRSLGIDMNFFSHTVGHA